jgi:hypothetical protein
VQTYVHYYTNPQRKFLPPDPNQLYIQEYINIEEDEDFSQWEPHQALAVLQRDIGDIDPTKVKLVSSIFSRLPHDLKLIVSSLTLPLVMNSSFCQL